jgi:hypothetical protein
MCIHIFFPQETFVKNFPGMAIFFSSKIKKISQPNPRLATLAAFAANNRFAIFSWYRLNKYYSMFE